MADKEERMIPEKQNGIRLCLTGILCVLLFFLSVGVAQGRIRLTKTIHAPFQAIQMQQVCIWDGATGDTEDFQEISGWTETEAGKAALRFQVINGNTDEFCGIPLRFCVRIAVSLGVQNPDHVQIKLQIQEKEYIGKATPILEGSARYQTFGPGWIYGFYDDSGNELSWELLGGELSAVEAVLLVEGTGAYASLLRAEVTAFPGV